MHASDATPLGCGWLDLMRMELELLDQLPGGEMRVDPLRTVFDTREHFNTAVLAMLDAGDLRLLNVGGEEVPHWQWLTVLELPSVGGISLSITDARARKIR